MAGQFKGLLVPVDIVADAEVITFRQDDNLASLYAAMGCSMVQQLPLNRGHGLVALADEEGTMNGAEYNHVASLIVQGMTGLRHEMFGAVVFATQKGQNWGDVPEDFAEMVKRHMKGYRDIIATVLGEEED